MMNGPSEDRWMEQAASDDAAAFDRIVERHQHRVQRFATRMLGGDASRGADVAVGAFLRLWEARHSFQACGKLEAWLLRTANRLCLDMLATSGRTEPLDDSQLAPGDVESRIEQSLLAGAVRDAVMELPESHRSVVILSTYEEMSYDEIAAVLEIPAGTVASRKNHAIAALRRRLAAWENL